MTLRFVDSFDHYDTAQLLRKWSTFVEGPSPAISAGNGRHGSSSLRFTNTEGGIVKALDNQSTWTLGLAIRMATQPNNTYPLIAFLDGSTTQVFLAVQSDGTLTVRRGDNTVLGTCATSFTAGPYQYLELKATIHNSAGTVEVRLNGASVLSLSGIDTQQSGNAFAGSVGLGNGSGFTVNIDYDDLYICDGTGSSPQNGFLGDVRVDATLPDGAGNSAQWTPSAGSNWQNVDENPATDDTDYNSSTTANQVDIYAYPTLAPTAGTVYGVALQLMVRKDDAGSRSIAGVVRSGGADFAGSSQAVADGYLIFTDIREEDPDTSAAWTIAGVNAAEFGIKLIS